jgi:hypothetical protein
VFDVVELLGPEDAPRLRRYAAGDGAAGDGAAGDGAAGDAGPAPHMQER